MHKLVVCALTLCLLGVDANCPFSKQAKAGESHKPRGHNQPFGHHARHWKRVKTVFEHPDPVTFYNDFVRTSTPLLIRGGAAEWPAIKKWTNITYVNEFGGKERSHVNWKKIYPYDRHHAIRIDMTMKEFTDKFDTHDLYMDATIPVGLHEDVYWPHSLGCMFFLKRMKQLAIMMNNGRSRSDVHIDVTDTYFMQATGKRLWLMSPPSNVTKVYSGHPNLVDHSGISILNQTHMDLEKHAEAMKLDIYAAYLNPGDIVYVPEAWYHQVVTYDSPNIAIVAFLNIMFCEYATEGKNDIDHVTQCANRVRTKKPKNLECDAFPRKNINIKQLLKKYNPRTSGAFQGYFGTPPALERFRNYMKFLPDKSILPALGMTLNGMTPEALAKGNVLRQGFIEGFRLFTTAPGDGSEEALGRAFSKYKKLAKMCRVISYLSIERAQQVGVEKSLEESARAMNITGHDIVMLTAPYCKPDYEARECTRNDFQQSWADTWKALEKLQKEKKIRFLGVSDFSQKELKQLLAIATVPVTIARARFDIYFRNTKFRHFCNDNKIYFMGRSVLGGRWKEEQPNYPRNRDILKEYIIQKAAYQYKISIHAAVYDWAVKKRVIVAPRVNDPLHVRVNIKSIDSESNDTPTNIREVDALDPTDKDGLYTPMAQSSPFSRRRQGKAEPNEGGEQGEEEEEEEVEEEKTKENTRPEKYGKGMSDARAEKKKLDGVSGQFSGNYSELTYTDDIDFEDFPTYMLGREAKDD